MGLYDYSVTPGPLFFYSELLKRRNLQVSSFEKFSGGVGWGGGGGLFDYSVKPGPHFVKVKARFGQVSDQINQG